MLGLTACCVAKAQGAKTIIACDIDPGRLELARTFGADHCLLVSSLGDEDFIKEVHDITAHQGVGLACEFSGYSQDLSLIHI